MTVEIALVLGLILVAISLLALDLFRVDMVAVGVLLVVTLSGLLTAQEALSAFSNTAIVTVGSMFIISQGLLRTGVASQIGRSILKVTTDSEARLIAVLMLTAGLLSAFMNDVGSTAILLPALVGIARQTRISPSKLCIPLAFGSLLGGLCTLIGTPANILISDALESRGFAPFAIFDFTPVGLILLELALGPPDGPALDAARTLARIARGRLGSLRRRLRALPHGLRQVVSRCLELHPGDRYRDAGELEADLEDLRGGRPPRLGALGPISRRLRAMRRHPIRSAVALAALILLGWTSWYAWWTWPQEVHIDTHLDGKVIWIDGVERGSTPLDVRLRPGEHTYRCSFLSGERGQPTLTGTFRVPHRSHSYPFFVFDIQHGLPGIDTGILPEQPSALVQISTPHPRIDVEIDGEVYADQPGIVAARLTLGRHEIRIWAPGKRVAEEAIDLTDQQSCMLSYELDDIDSAWHTVVLYSPFDHLVRRGLVDVKQARILCEDSQAGFADPTFVFKVYWGPTKNYEEASVLMLVDLPGASGDLHFQLDGQDLVQKAGACWNLLEMGPGPDTLIPMCAARPEKLPSSVAPSGLELIPTPERIDALLALLEGRRRLYIRFRMDGAPVGGNVAYACALRSNALPFRPPGGEILWSPALRIRVRE